MCTERPIATCRVSRIPFEQRAGADDDIEQLESQLVQVEDALGRHHGLLPIGVGLLSFVLKGKTEATLAVLQKFRPSVIWLFAATQLDDYATWAAQARSVSPESQIWVQVGSVEGALRIAKETRPDVMCIQGIDAGGKTMDESWVKAHG